VGNEEEEQSSDGEEMTDEEDEIVRPVAPHVPDHLAPVLTSQLLLYAQEQAVHLLSCMDLTSLLRLNDVLSLAPDGPWRFHRMNMVQVIPEFNAVLIASQSGTIGFFRLTTYGGRYYLRLESTIPHPPHSHPLAGICASPVGGATKNWRIHVLDLEGGVSAFEIRRRSEGWDVGELII